jgi:hypothetical protein
MKRTTVFVIATLSVAACSNLSPTERKLFGLPSQEDELRAMTEKSQQEEQQQARIQTAPPIPSPAQNPIKPVDKSPVWTTTKGYRYVLGTIVCPDYDRVMLMWQLYGEAYSEHALSTYTNGQSELLHGKPYRGPNLQAFGCDLIPPGTKVLYERDKIVPVISGITPSSGKPFKGVTMYDMVQQP